MTHDGGGGDIFEGMSHEQMLAWLDQADPGTLQGAADKLAAAARTIHDIAGDLRTRPQQVAWQGEGAEAFRAWGADLTNATTHLGDFSAHAGRWLMEASHAIARAKAQMPPLPDGDGKPNDGKGAGGTTGGKAAGDLTGEKEKARLEAVAEMRKLGQAYAQASSQMDTFRRPVFPPVPDVVAPAGGRDDSQDLPRQRTTAQPGAVAGSTGGSVVRQHGSVSDILAASRPESEAPDDRSVRYEVRHIGTDLDSVDLVSRTPNQSPPLPDGPPRHEIPPVTGRTDPGMPFTPPPQGQGPGRPVPTARGRVPSEGPATPGRVPPRQVSGGVPQQRETTSRTPTGRPQNPTHGIVGGRPAQTPTGRAPAGTSRSPVVGGKGTQKNSPPASRTGGATRTPVPRSGRPSASNPNRPKTVAPTTPSRGEPPARSLPPRTTGGVIGSQNSQREPSGRLPSGTSAPTRGGIAGGVPSMESRAGSHGAGAPVQADGSESSRDAEQRPSRQPEKPKPPQRHVTSEPKKKRRPSSG